MKALRLKPVKWISAGFLLVFSFLFLPPVTAQAGSEGGITIFVRPNPLKVELNIPSTVLKGQRFRITAHVYNMGDGYIEDASVSIQLPEGLRLLRRTSMQQVGRIRPAGEKTVSWPAQAERAGVYVITASARGADAPTGTELTAEDTATIAVLEGLSRRMLLLLLFF